MLDRDQRPRDTPDGPAAAPEAADPGWLVAPYPPFAPDDLQHALNHNQIACKTWLLDALFEALGGRFATVTVLGGWYGLLGALLLGDGRFQVDRVLSYDLDPDCARGADWLNRTHTPPGRSPPRGAPRGPHGRQRCPRRPRRSYRRGQGVWRHPDADPP